MWCAHTALPGRNLNDDQWRSSPGVHLARGRAGVEDEGYSLQGAPRPGPTSLGGPPADVQFEDPNRSPCQPALPFPSRTPPLPGRWVEPPGAGRLLGNPRWVAASVRWVGRASRGRLAGSGPLPGPPALPPGSRVWTTELVLPGNLTLGARRGLFNSFRM